MASWFAKRRSIVDIPRLKPRRAPSPVTHVSLSELSPRPLPFLGQAAYLKLDAFQSLASAVAAVSDLHITEPILGAAEQAISTHRRLTAEIVRLGADPIDEMTPFAGAIDRFQEATGGADWQERLLGVYLTGGLLDDFFVHFAEGLPGDVRTRVIPILRADTGMADVVTLLSRAAESDERLVSRFALWGRRLVGDTLLVARSALELSDARDWPEEKIEPVFTELMAAHTRRMDGLGLTA